MIAPGTGSDSERWPHWTTTRSLTGHRPHSRYSAVVVGCCTAVGIGSRQTVATWAVVVVIGVVSSADSWPPRNHCKRS